MKLQVVRITRMFRDIFVVHETIFRNSKSAVMEFILNRIENCILAILRTCAGNNAIWYPQYETLKHEKNTHYGKLYTTLISTILVIIENLLST
jgi:hypothetical protein